jgi:hypothetical protein
LLKPYFIEKTFAQNEEFDYSVKCFSGFLLNIYRQLLKLKPNQYLKSEKKPTRLISLFGFWCLNNQRASAGFKQQREEKCFFVFNR